jgi:hypothetical protein
MPELEARLKLRGLEAKVQEYLSALDSALETLSSGQEGVLARVPAWCLSRRELRMAVNRDGRGAALRIVPNPKLEKDESCFEEIETTNQLRAFLRPWNTDTAPEQLSRTPFGMFGPLAVTLVGDPLAPAALDERGLIGFGQLSGAEAMFTAESGQKDAIELWNSAVAGLPHSGSFIEQAKGVFDRFDASIRLKAFRERRIHRMLRDHAALLLPAFKRVFFEHELYLGDEVRKADFILEREFGLPGLLIELESPVYTVFRKNGHLTAEATHAHGQILEWVEFIDREPQRNAAGEMAFLLAEKQRLVIMGRGLEQREALLKRKFSDTAFWTYDLLLEQARRRWNDILVEQCRRVGRSELKPF